LDFYWNFRSGVFLFLRNAELRWQLKGKTTAISKLTTGFVYAFSRLSSAAAAAAAVT